ncbi:hypothetical protein NQ317_019475 [Molorchus minor]|uniref:Nbr1 FW domain-containing protein n=1 Tax=Molorchus minor TaxID=1323400 RepID=A0ABQ9JNT1_9CUCU|nr:hypothetical protein NQ317_019475 [Molorchus minor]
MDIDNGTNDGHVTGGLDIEQSLLQQFSCMGTTDKDELVQQLQKLLGSHVYAVVNLQAAICSYLDFEAPTQLPSMALVSDPVASETESIEPNVWVLLFQKTWHLCNNGTETWPSGCYAQCSDGDNLGGSRVYLPCLQPGEGMHLSVNMTGPSVPGIYQSKWRLCTPKGAYFGDPMWAIVTVVEEGTIALTQQLSHFNELGALPPSTYSHNPFLPQRLHRESKQDTPPDGNDSQMC